VEFYLTFSVHLHAVVFNQMDNITKLCISLYSEGFFEQSAAIPLVRKIAALQSLMFHVVLINVFLCSLFTNASSVT
jgi:hypothetical protein